MRHLAKALLLALAMSSLAIADDTSPAVSIDGEVYAKKSVGHQPNGDRLLEFVRDAESFDKWTKLVGYRYQQLPGLGNDPMKYAAVMVQLVRQANPSATFQILRNEQTNEPIIDFLTWPKDQKYMELNVFKFWKSRDGKAVVSLQLAYRLEAFKPTLTRENMDEIGRTLKELKERRQSWIKQAIESDTRLVEAALLAQ